MIPRLDRWTEISVPPWSWAGSYEQGRAGWDGEMTSGLLVKEGQALPLFWRYHLMAQPEAASTSSHGSAVHSLLRPSEEETQAGGCLNGLPSSWHQVSKFGPLHFGEENGNHPQKLPHGAGSKERFQGWKWAQVRHEFQLVNKQGFCEQLLWNPRNLCFPLQTEEVMLPLGEQVWDQRTNLRQLLKGNKISGNLIQLYWNQLAPKDKVIFFFAFHYYEMKYQGMINRNPVGKFNAETTEVYSWLSWTKASLSPNKNWQLLGGRKNSLVGWPVSCTSGWAEVGSVCDGLGL